MSPAVTASVDTGKATRTTLDWLAASCTPAKPTTRSGGTPMTPRLTGWGGETGNPPGTPPQPLGRHHDDPAVDRLVDVDRNHLGTCPLAGVGDGEGRGHGALP